MEEFRKSDIPCMWIKCTLRNCVSLLNILTFQLKL